MFKGLVVLAADCLVCFISGFPFLIYFVILQVN